MNTQHAQRVYFEQLKRLVPLTMVLARYGIELRTQGQQLYGICPIHHGSNKRQFTVKPATSEWHCFGDCKCGSSSSPQWRTSKFSKLLVWSRAGSRSARAIKFTASLSNGEVPSVVDDRR